MTSGNMSCCISVGFFFRWMGWSANEKPHIIRGSNDQKKSSLPWGNDPKIYGKPMENPWFSFGKWSANGGVSTSLCMFNRRFFRGWDRGPSLEVRCIPFISASPLHRWCAIGGQVGLLQSHKCPAYGITVSHISHVYIIIYTHIHISN